MLAALAAVLLLSSGCNWNSSQPIESASPQSETPQQLESETYPPVQAEEAAKVGEEVEAKNKYGQTFLYRVDSVEKTKELGGREGFDLAEDPYFDEAVDETGRLTGKKTFVFVTITITNTEEVPLTPYLNTLRIYSSEQATTASGPEPQYLNPAQNKGKSQFAYTFEPNQPETVELGYTVPDDQLDNMYFIVGRDMIDVVVGDLDNPIEGDRKAIDLNAQ